MSTPRPPDPVHFFISVLYRNSAGHELAVRKIRELIGPPEHTYGPRPFDYSNYYHREMGRPLEKIYYIGKELRPPDDLPSLKLAANRIEIALSDDDRRTVNLDPGYIDKHHIILATSKAKAARPHLAHGVHAYLALIFEHETYRPLDWTYLDYREPALIAFFNEVRQGLLHKLKSTLSRKEEQ